MNGSGSPRPTAATPPSVPAAATAGAALERPGTLRRRLLATGLGGVAAGLFACGLAVHALLAQHLVDRQADATGVAAATLATAAGVAGPARLEELLSAAAADPRVEGLSLRVGEEVVFQAGVATAGADASRFASTLRAAVYDAPEATAVAAVTLGSSGGVAELVLRMRADEHGADLRRLDAWLLLSLLGAFVAVAPFVARAVFVQTSPLAELRDAVVGARRAGRGTGPAAAPPERFGSSELLALCRAIDALGADVADARLRLSTANEELTQQIQSRTAELRSANRQLELEADDKDHFLRAVTHDLNAPLRNIDGLSKLLISKHGAELSEGAASRLERISINVKHQHELINDLLELSRLRTKAHRSTELRLGELVDEVASGLGFDLESGGIDFAMIGDWPVVHAERNRLRQVFQNLIDNAIKYMMDSQVRRITVGVTRERDFNADIFEGVDSYRFTVADTGRGIAEEDLASVFRVFSRSTHSGTHDVAGRGVGLACVDAIVQRFGGSVGVESTLGEGSTFWFTLPVAAVSAEAADFEDAAAASVSSRAAA